MKYIILFLLLPFLSFSQGGTWPVKYGDSDPSGAPSASGTRVYFNTATNTLFFWEPAPSSTWRKQPKSFDQISGCAAPAYTPTARQSTFAVNSCDPPELYQYTGSAWVKLNGGGSYTAGANIDITGNAISLTGNLPVERFNGGTNAANNTYWRGDGLWAGLPGSITSLNGLSPAIQTFATNTTGTDFSIQSFGSTHTFRLPTASATNRGALSSADWSTFNSKDPSSTNEIQTLSISGQDLSLSLGGGTVTIPAGASLGNGFTAGGGSGTIPDGTVASLNTNSMRFGTTNARNLSNAIGFKKDEENYFLAGTNDDVDGQYTAFFSGKIGDNLTEYQVDGYGLSVTAYDASGNYSYVLVNAGNIAIGNTASNTGAQYAGDYSAGIITNPTSITDVTSVNLLKQTPVSYTNAAAPNNTIFYSTTLSKLAYKDPGGTVNALY